MSILSVLESSDPGLRAVCVELLAADMEAALALASDMTQTLVLSNAGIALAAPQVGHAVRMFVIRPSCARRFGMHHVIINPSWRPASQKARRREGCLSFPGVFVDKQRHPAIVAEWTDHAGKHRKKTITDPLLAQIFQHEVEHLTGVLLTDR